MKRKDITKASSVFKKTEQERIGYFHNDISLNSVAVISRQGLFAFNKQNENMSEVSILLWP